ncbi:MAG: ATP-dependent DNA helicase RecG [Candidatus Cloacimonetes bacterium ADurb.Bin089]|nr:MAG: ATP-dependent DNA helicase RecG [Candidatus Cloacimonetes bacterium ADurb.Bin089]
MAFNMAESKKTTDLNSEVKYLKGVGENRAKLLRKLGIKTILDLMEHFPKDYISRKLSASLSDLKPGDILAFTAMISWVDVHLSTKGKSILSVGVSDGKVGIICSWFSYPAIYTKLFTPGRLVWLNGTITEFNGQLEMLHPEFELIDDPEDAKDDFWKKREVLPIYSLTEGIKQKLMRQLIYNAFSLYSGLIEEKLPDYLIAKHHFEDRNSGLQKMHFSQKPEETESVRRRFAYEEFFYTQLLWARHKIFHTTQTKGIMFINKKQLTTGVYKNLPFTLTKAQKKVLWEIFADMCSEKQMSRLLQGDVGSGKTVVALFAMLLTVENGYQAVLMAPTEILAEQHYETITKLLKGFEVRVCLLKGGGYKGKEEIKEAIASGEANIVIGTHALLQKDIHFKRLGFACVDEQHRFGVEQRARLAKLALHPDLLYLSATPIPRSLAMTVYGDLEVSILDELPPTRKPVLTVIRPSSKIDLVYREVQEQLALGRQVYIVCPLVEESEKVALLDATKLYEYISRKVFPEYPSCLLHGRMPVKEKDAIMQRFKAGEIKILVSTTVIEVGVDVPNASVMIVEHSERFGLAQLHQLRGRVGRGSDQAYCYLIEHHPISEVAWQRLTTMTKTTDGFIIAEKDLELRGPGEMFGYEQSGIPVFRFANLVRDQEILKLARQDAFEIVRADPDFNLPENALLKKIYFSQFTAKEQLILY